MAELRIEAHPAGTPVGAASLAGRSSSETRPPPRPLAAALQPESYALLLDLDGTLVEFAARPDEVAVDPALLELLVALRAGTHGALALVSGRSIATLDRLTAPERFAAAGVHGFEVRSASGRRVSRVPRDAADLGDVRAYLARLVAEHPQLLLEDKGYSLALHYRRAPHLQPLAAAAAANLAGRNSGLRVQRGSMVVELMPAGISKATAVADLMGERPFLGRQPVYVGDDLTDESAFHWVNGAGGLSVRVGAPRPSAAQAHLDSVAAARAWLRALVTARGASA